jgi:2-methylcitrate dehydratase PrpD
MTPAQLHLPSEAQHTASKAVIESYYSDSQKGDLTPFIRDYLHPEFSAVAPNYVPLGGKVHTAQTFKDEVVPQLERVLDYSRFKYESLIAEGDHVCCTRLRVRAADGSAPNLLRAASPPPSRTPSTTSSPSTEWPHCGAHRSANGHNGSSPSRTPITATNCGSRHPEPDCCIDEGISRKEDHAVTRYDVDKHPSRRLADFVAATPREVVPAEVVTRLRRLVLDWIGITAFAGHHAENADAVRAAADKLDAGAGATVVGQAHTHSPLYAALLNGCFAHSMDFDDTNIIQAGHPGAPVIAAALADAERLGVDMAAFYDAVAFGYEVDCRVGAALGPSAYDRGFHITAVAGIFGAVAASARLRGLDADVTDSAFGLALSKAAGSMQYLANGSWNKRLHPGFAAHDGLLCVELAQAGVIGAAEALEGRYGLLHSYTDDAQPGQLTDELTTRWMLLQTAIKPYPSCRWTHGAIDAALALRPQVPAEQRPDAHISVWLSPTAYPIVGEPQPHKLTPTNTVDAQFSVYFQFAAA